MMSNNFNNFDFEKWSSLASTDPEAFEQHREQIINSFIQDLPEEKQQRMRCLQWRVDSVRKLSKTPMAACIEISNMMWDSVKGEHGLLQALHSLTDACLFNAPASKNNLRQQYNPTSILPFPGNSAQKPELTTKDLL